MRISLIRWWHAWRLAGQEAHRRRREWLEFEQIIKASYRPNVGQVLPGEIPVIAPRVSDFR